MTTNSLPAVDSSFQYHIQLILLNIVSILLCKFQQRYHDILELFHIHTSLNDFKIFAPQLFQESNVLSK